jgi:hypothetical protein
LKISPLSSLPQAVRDGSELDILKVVGHGNVGLSCNNFAGLLFVLELDTI